MKIKFLGHSAFLLEGTSFNILIDPFLTGNPMYKGTLSDFDRIDYILVTHGHGDHVGDTIELAKKYDATVIANFEISNIFAESDIKTHSMHIGGRYTFDFGRLKMTPALHGSSIEHNDQIVYGGNPCGFVIELDQKTIYHAGDTGLTMDMKLLEKEKIDVAILPIGGNFTMDIEDALIAVDFLKPKQVIPMHYNTFGLIAVDTDTFVSGLKTTEGIILDPMGTHEI